MTPESRLGILDRSFGLLALAALLGSLGACGSKPPEVEDKPKPYVRVIPPQSFQTPGANSEAVKEQAIHVAAEFADKKYPGKLSLIDPITSFIQGPDPTPGGGFPQQTQTGPMTAPPMPGTPIGIGTQRPPERGPATGPQPTQGPPSFANLRPPQMRVAESRGYWKILFRLLKPVLDDPDAPPMSVRVFCVFANGRVVELEAMNIPLPAGSHNLPETAPPLHP